MVYTNEPCFIQELKIARALLENIGYTAAAADEPALRFCIESVYSTVKNTIHCKNVPKELEHIVMRRVIGEFLKSKKIFAPNDLTMIDLDCAVKQIQEGDINISFAVGSGSLTPEQRMDNFINSLLNAGQDEIMHYRRLQW